VLVVVAKYYNFLEEVKQAHNSTHRLTVGFGHNLGGCGSDDAQLSRWLFYLITVAHHRGVRLCFLSIGMSRREQNRSQNSYKRFALLIQFFLPSLSCFAAGDVQQTCSTVVE
jgi:hypothetical protein